MKRPNLMVTGAKISQLRREQGMCIFEFARQIEAPVWLLMLLESLDEARNMELVELLPDRVVDELLQRIIEVYGVSRRWLTTWYRSPKHPPLPQEEAAQPCRLYLPIMLSAEDVVYFIEDAIRLLSMDSKAEFEADCALRQGVISMTYLHQLLLALQKRNGEEDRAAQEADKLHQLLRSRIEALEAQGHSPSAA